MKPLQYAVVIQWGAGMIYFNSFHSEEAKAQQAAEGQRKVYAARRKQKGAKPTVTLWKQLEV